MIRRLLIPLMVVSALLSGCVAANVAYLGVVVANTTFSTVFYPEGDGTKPSTELDSVTRMTYTREFWREDGQGKCVYSGLIVPWERTWPMETNDGEGNTTTLPPEPGVRAGYLTLVNTKACAPAAPQHVLFAGEQRTARAFLGGGFDGKPLIRRALTASTADMLTIKPANRPLWFPQAVERITRLAKTQPAAKAFLVASQADLVRLLPDQAQAIATAIQ